MYSRLKFCLLIEIQDGETYEFSAQYNNFDESYEAIKGRTGYIKIMMGS